MSRATLYRLFRAIPGADDSAIDEVLDAIDGQHLEWMVGVLTAVVLVWMFSGMWMLVRIHERMGAIEVTLRMLADAVWPPRYCQFGNEPEAGAGSGNFSGYRRGHRGLARIGAESSTRPQATALLTSCSNSTGLVQLTRRLVVCERGACVQLLEAHPGVQVGSGASHSLRVAGPDRVPCEASISASNARSSFV